VKRAVVASALLCAACSSSLTTKDLTPSFEQSFGNLYVDQQRALGRTDVGLQSLHPLTSCRRTGTDVAGPGDDWLCTVQYTDGGAPTAQSFEVQLKPDGCWKADGPSTAQPAQLADPSTGALVTNPLSQFDGCFDTSW
jgi:hypothetical protein